MSSQKEALDLYSCAGGLTHPAVTVSALWAWVWTVLSPASGAKLTPDAVNLLEAILNGTQAPRGR